MYTRKAFIKNPSGLHARPASDFTRCASKFRSKLMIKRLGNDSLAVNAKSIITILTLGLSMGEEFELIGDGEDETEAVDSLMELVSSGFGEL